MTNFTRRSFIKTGSVAGAGMLMSSPLHLAGAQHEPEISREVLADARALTAAALAAAKSKGATYADVQFRLTQREHWSIYGMGNSKPSRSMAMGVGIRTLINGYWGFAGQDGILSIDNAARLGREAAAQARIASSRGKPRSVDLVPAPVVADGRWSTPIEIDPFTVSFEEKIDFFTGMNNFITRQGFGVAANGSLGFQKDERVLATSDGSFTRQTIHLVDSGLGLGVPEAWQTEIPGRSVADFLSHVGAGWEHVTKAPFQDNARRLIDEALRSRFYSRKPVEVGRYDIVFDTETMASLIGSTIGIPTELDRAFGYLANDLGTSYLNDPLEMLGTYKLGSPLLTITANRSMPQGCATVKWDEEGVEPADFTLIKDGILTDFQTTRESARWIADYYSKKGMPVRSNGCSGLYEPTMPATQVSPNLVMQPGEQTVTFDDLVKDTKKGLAVIGGYTAMDFQGLNGGGSGQIYEIVNGKLGSVVTNAEYSFRSPDLWKNLVAIGGQESMRSIGLAQSRGEGVEFHTVACVPGKFTGVAVFDGSRKA